MQRNVLVIFATYAEAFRSLIRVQAKEVIDNKLYTFGEGSIVISGLGCLAGCSAVSAFAKDATEVWNLGAAGCLHRNLVLSEVVEVSTVIRNPILPDQIDDHSRLLHECMFSAIDTSAQGYRLVSSDYPIHHPKLRRRLGKLADLIDMEGYGIAYAARELGVPVRLWKSVSDFANPDGPLLIWERLDHTSQILANVLTRCLL